MKKISHFSDVQSDSNDLKQLDLLANSFDDRVDIDVNTIKRQPTLQAAIGLCISASGKDRKQVYGALGIDAATFSRIESGQAHFPPSKLTRLMDLCGNESPLIWLIEARGYDFSSLRRHFNDTERRLQELQQENADLKRAFGLVAGFRK